MSNPTGWPTCWVYKSPRKPELYLFVAAKDDFARVPGALLESLGELELALSFELKPGRRMARADPAAVKSALEQHGYYLQLPPPKTIPKGPNAKETSHG